MNVDVGKLIRDSDEYRQAVCNWLRVNGINPDDVPVEERPTITDGQITIRMFKNNSVGRRQFDPAHPNGLAKHTVTVPLRYEPQGDVVLWLTPPCETGER